MSTEKGLLTCLTCRLLFSESETMRVHYKTDFHRFNLKRKVANLLPVTEEMFDSKLHEIQTTENQNPKGKQHLKQNKQKNNSLPNEKKIQIEKQQPKSPRIDHVSPRTDPVSSPRTDPVSSPTAEDNAEVKTEDQLIDIKIANAPRLTLKDSLFDRFSSSDFESNLQYMTKKFGFFIPEIEYLKDLPGLIKYLGEKISIGNICIFCDKGFYSMDAARDHMRELCHCRMKWEDNEDEYNDYYDVEEANKRFEVSDKVYVSQFNELVLSDKNKAVGHRALNIFYKQKHGNSSQVQLMTSLLQEHKRLAAIENQKRVNVDAAFKNKQAYDSMKLGVLNNRQPRYRNQNPL